MYAKNWFVKLVLVVLIVILAFSMAACGDGGDGTKTCTDGTVQDCPVVVKANPLTPVICALDKNSPGCK